MELNAAKAIRLYKQSKKELEEALEPFVGPDLAKILPIASCPEGQESLEQELLLTGVLGDLAALDLIEWEGKIRPPKRSPYTRYRLTHAATKCASRRGIPISIDELEKLA
ncbi:MAG TPA: hypothetical protein EYP33_06030 [Pyrodictium sp.]|nr:hypothetical protein [Pyrodictium sp.]